MTVDASSIAAGQRVSVTDGQGTIVASFVAGSPASSVTIASAGITAGQQYTVLTGQSASATSTSGLHEVTSATATDGSQVGAMGGPGRGRP